MKLNFLPRGEVHIWSASLLEFEDCINYLVSILSDDERERISKFRFLKDQKQFVIARGILRCLLSLYLGQLPENVEIVYSLLGKPCLREENSLHFNISHSSNYVLYAFSYSYEVGIDLEYIDRDFNPEEVVLNIFSPLELYFWKKINSKNKIDYFFNYWVCKEAFLKASGKGWLKNEQDIIFEEPILLLQRQKNLFLKNKRGYLYCFEHVSGYASALFINGSLLHPFHCIWERSALEANMSLLG